MVAAALMGLVPGAPAVAGGYDPITPARDRYEAGQTVTMIGYGDAGDDIDGIGPVHAYLRVDRASADTDLAAATATADPSHVSLVHHTDLRVGEVVIAHSGATDVPHGYGPHRASITFDLPEQLEPGTYQVIACADPCWTGPGVLWAEPVNVGVDPEHPVVRYWPLSEPGIRWLEDDALIAHASGTVTAADVRAGRLPSTSPLPPVMAPGPATATTPAPQPTADPDRPAAAEGGAAVDGDDRGPGDVGPALRPQTDGGAAAWWVATEIAVLLVGAVLALAWTGRRRRRAARPAPDRVRPSVVPAPDADRSDVPDDRHDRGPAPAVVAAVGAVAVDDETPDPLRRGQADTRPIVRL